MLRSTVFRTLPPSHSVWDRIQLDCCWCRTIALAIVLLCCISGCSAGTAVAPVTPTPGSGAEDGGDSSRDEETAPPEPGVAQNNHIKSFGPYLPESTFCLSKDASEYLLVTEGKSGIFSTETGRKLRDIRGINPLKPRTKSKCFFDSQRDRCFFVYPNNPTVSLVDLTTGKSSLLRASFRTLGYESSDSLANLPIQKIAWSDDGKLGAALSDSGMAVWSLDDSRLIAQFHDSELFEDTLFFRVFNDPPRLVFDFHDKLAETDRGIYWYFVAWEFTSDDKPVSFFEGKADAGKLDKQDEPVWNIGSSRTVTRPRIVSESDDDLRKRRIRAAILRKYVNQLNRELIPEEDLEGYSDGFQSIMKSSSLSRVDLRYFPLSILPTHPLATSELNGTRVWVVSSLENSRSADTHQLYEFDVFSGEVTNTRSLALFYSDGRPADLGWSPTRNFDISQNGRVLVTSGGEVWDTSENNPEANRLRFEISSVPRTMFHNVELGRRLAKIINGRMVHLWQPGEYLGAVTPIQERHTLVDLSHRLSSELLVRP